MHLCAVGKQTLKVLGYSEANFPPLPSCVAPDFRVTKLPALESLGYLFISATDVATVVYDLPGNYSQKCL